MVIVCTKNKLFFKWSSKLEYLLLPSLDMKLSSKAMIRWTWLVYCEILNQFNTAYVFAWDWYEKLVRARQTTLSSEFYSLALVFHFILVFGQITNELIHILFCSNVPLWFFYYLILSMNPNIFHFKLQTDSV